MTREHGVKYFLDSAKYADIYCEWAPNEKVAMEVSFGASLAGKRSFCAMKHVGLNVAADPLFTLSYTGINAGMVIGVADDPGMHSSQNEQDSRHYAIGAKVPMLEPSDSKEALEFTKIAFDLSEEYDTPVLLRMCTRISHSQSIVTLSEKTNSETKPFYKNIRKYVMVPGNARLRRPIVEERTARLIEYAETSPLNRMEMGNAFLGIIAAGTAYQYAKEVFGKEASYLKLGMVNPLPEKLIREFAEKVDRLIVIEELDPIIETHCRLLGLSVEGKTLFPMIGEFSQNLISEKLGRETKAGKTLEDEIPVRPPVMCAGCPHRGIFYILSKLKLNVLGDIGCYALGAAVPLNAMHTCICMGSSISSLHGFNIALGRESEKNTVAVIGDSTFLHTGVNSLINIGYNGSNSTVIILDNSITGMTGHQQNPATGYNIKGDPAGKVDLEALCRACGINRVRVVDPYDLEECEAVVREELDADEPSVIIARRPCVLLKHVTHGPPVFVKKEACRSCKICMRLGCPAIHLENGKAAIDETLCAGCEVCISLCPFDAIQADKEGV
jgi:indolepyruvate ferredoxin oxidoreductase alpha subunit